VSIILLIAIIITFNRPQKGGCDGYHSNYKHGCRLIAINA
jgi:hypothetical protein